MAKISIVGDSWGTQKGWPTDLQKTERHLQGYLRKAGHKVNNFSIPGGSNGTSINRAIKYFKRKPKLVPHYIIWFHTESLRDREHGFNDREFNIADLTKEKATLNYKQFKELIELTGAKDLIIGGQAPVIPELLEHQPYYLFEDWRSELLGTPSVMTHSICHPELFESQKCKDDAETRTKMIEDNIRILDMCRASRYFPDDAHPGGEAHYLLLTKIIDYIK